MIQLSPIVKHLIITNVVIYVGLLLMYESGATFLYEDYFTLYKSNALGFRKTLEIDYETYYLPSNQMENLSADQVNQYEQMNPGTKSRIQEIDNREGKFIPIQLVTYFFNHSRSDLFHILFNMLALLFLGPITESVLGSRAFLKFYLFCGIVGGLMIAFLDPNNYPVVGASVAVSGVLVAFAMNFPNQKLYFMFIPIGIKAKWFVSGIAAISAIFVFLDAIGADSIGNISHFGHLAGMIAALLFFYLGRYIPQLVE